MNGKRSNIAISRRLWYDALAVRADRLNHHPQTDKREVVAMTLTEVLELLTLLAVVIFGVIEVTKK